LKLSQLAALRCPPPTSHETAPPPRPPRGYAQERVQQCPWPVRDLESIGRVPGAALDLEAASESTCWAERRPVNRHRRSLAERNTGPRRQRATKPNRPSRTAAVITTWLCSLRGRASPPPPHSAAVVWRYSAANQIPARAPPTPRLRSGRRDRSGTVSVGRTPGASRTGALCAASIPRRVSSSPRAHSTDHRLRRAEGPHPHLRPRPPPAPSRRSHRPLRGWRPSISAMKSAPSNRLSLDPETGPGVSALASHRPAGCCGSPSGVR